MEPSNLLPAAVSEPASTLTRASPMSLDLVPDQHLEELQGYRVRWRAEELSIAAEEPPKVMLPFLPGPTAVGLKENLPKQPVTDRPLQELHEFVPLGMVLPEVLLDEKTGCPIRIDMPLRIPRRATKRNPATDLTKFWDLVAEGVRELQFDSELVYYSPILIRHGPQPRNHWLWASDVNAQSRVPASKTRLERAEPIRLSAIPRSSHRNRDE